MSRTVAGVVMKTNGGRGGRNGGNRGSLRKATADLCGDDSAEALQTVEKTTGGFGIAWDIDGVLLQSSTPFPYTKATLSHLHEHDIDHIFLTNSGGKTEAERVTGMSKTFGTPVALEQFVQSHTPFQNLVGEYANKNVLIIGGVGDNCRKVAEEYGFKNVITTADLIVAHPRIWCFNDISPNYYKGFARALPQEFDPTHPETSLRISAIFVFNSSRDWGFDAQICLDLLMSDRGILGTTSPLNGIPSLPNHGYGHQPESCRIYAANPDFVWQTAYQHGPRFGQGAFLTALRAIYHEATEWRAYLEIELYGKPAHASYLYASKVMTDMRAAKGKAEPVKTMYMIGDNPASDIRGANEFRCPQGVQWISVLVETGVHQAGTQPRFKPHVTVSSALEAVRWICKREQMPDIIFDHTQAVVENAGGEVINMG